MSNGEAICYLCGDGIDKDLTREHVPPKQFFPKALRRKVSLNLLTLSAHKTCNESYSLDEEYFRCTLVPLMDDRKPLGAILFSAVKDKLNSPNAVGLRKKIVQEFREKTSSGVHFPFGMMSKTFDQMRVNRVVWKVFRGIYFHRTKVFLAEDLEHQIFLCHEQASNRDRAESLRQIVVNLPEGGENKGVFAYKYGETEPPGMCAFGLLFWDNIMFIGMFRHRVAVI